MKRAVSQSLFTLLLSILSVSTITTVLAQNTTDQRKIGIRGGVILGMNASQLDGDDYQGFHKVGFNGGFYGQIPVSKMFFFSTEILYSQKGGKSETYPGIPIKYSWGISYAEVPVLFHFQEKQAVNFGVGFSYSRFLKEHLIVDGEDQPEIDLCTGKPGDVSLLDPSYLCLSKNDFMVLVDGNYLPTKHLSINVRYGYSLSATGYYGSSNFINRSMHMNMLSFRVMWVFGGGQQL